MSAEKTLEKAEATTALVEEGKALSLTERDVLLLRRQLWPDLSDQEIVYVLGFCRAHGLNPWLRQVYAFKYGGRLVIQVSIDGFRLIAERSGKYAGQLGPHWCGPDGRWTDVWTKEEPPAAARVAVLRTDFKEPLWAVARYQSFCRRDDRGRPLGTWATMPDHMLAKVAEALALRRAFPQIGGLYTPTEMGVTGPVQMTVEGEPVEEIEEPRLPDGRREAETDRSRSAEKEEARPKPGPRGEEGTPAEKPKPTASPERYAERYQVLWELAQALGVPAPDPAEIRESMDAMGREGRRLRDLLRASGGGERGDDPEGIWLFLRQLATTYGVTGTPEYPAQGDRAARLQALRTLRLAVEAAMGQPYAAFLRQRAQALGWVEGESA
jgi:phage recombination protein Bet